MLIGHGFDIHRLVEGKELVIGGVNIPYELGADAHSDGDVIYHSVVDAILGERDKNIKNMGTDRRILRVVRATDGRRHLPQRGRCHLGRERGNKQKTWTNELYIWVLQMFDAIYHMPASQRGRCHLRRERQRETMFRLPGIVCP